MYNAICNALPPEWLKTLNLKRSDKARGIEYINQQVKVAQAKVTKVVYTMLINDQKIAQNQSITKWESEIDCEILPKVWANIQNYVHVLTKCTKLRSFQYRLTNRILTTNVHRFKWGLINSPLCFFCNQYPESYVHLFFECDYVQKVWKCLSNWLYYFCFIHFKPTAYEIIFNRYRDSFQDFVNTIILITKQFIYAKKSLAEKLNVNCLLYKISNYRNLERYTAIKNNHLMKFEKKWSIYDLV